MEPFEALDSVLANLDKTKVLNIFMHNHPDPDTIACALALQKIALRHGVVCSLCYSHESDFPANKKLLNRLNIPVTKLDNVENPEQIIKCMDYVALVDVASPEMVDFYDLIEDKVVIDIDHHPNGNKAEVVPGKFFYKEYAGACVTFFMEWMEALGIELDPVEDKALVLAAYLGIKVDTADFFYKSVGAIDLKSKAKLESMLTMEDYQEMFEIEHPKVPQVWSNKLGEVLQNFPNSTKSDLFYYGVGVVNDRGVIPYIADDIFKRRNFDTVIIYGLCYEPNAEGKGYMNLRILAAGRSVDADINPAEAFSNIFYKKMVDGKKVFTGGGRKSTRAVYVRGSIPLGEESELDVDSLEDVYKLWHDKINKRIENYFKLKEQV